MDSGLKVPRGLDSSLIIPSSSTRRSATATNTLNTSPDLPLPNSKSDVHAKGLLLWDKLTSLRDPHSITEPPRLLHTEFVHLPSRIDFPDYYALIKKPVCFHDIWTKLERLEYSSIAEVRNDFNQCFVNAKRYNAPGSGIFLDAKKLHKVLKQWYAHITGEAEAPEDDDAPAPLPSMNTYHQSPPTPQQPLPLHLPQQPVPIPVNYAHAHPSSNPNPNPNAEAGGPGPSTLLALPAAIPGTNFAKRGPTIKPWLTRKLAETTALVDANGRKFSDSFKSLPDKKEWAEYYKVITHPMSFDAITTKVTKRAYTSVQQFIDDVHLIFANAQFFNEESSRIWTDAQIMQLHFTEVMKEVPPTFIPPRKYNTAKRRAEAEALARGELAPPPSASTTSSVKKRRISSVAPGGGGGGGSEPPEEGEEADSGDDYEGEGSVPPSAAGGGGGGGGGGGTRGPSRATSLAPLGAAPPPSTLRQGSADPFHLPYDHHIKTEEEGLLPPVDPFAIPGSLLANAAIAEPMPPLPDLERLSRGGTPMDVDARDALVNGGGAVGEMAWGVEVGEGGEGELGGGGGGGAAMTGLDTGDPKLVARMKQEGEGEPLITRFLLTTTPSTTPLTLLNTPLTQHSLSLPPSITRLDFTPFFFSPSPSNIVQLAVRPAGVVVEPLAELPGPEGPTHRYSLVPRRGLNVVEFVVGGGAEGRKEVYRCFVTKG